MLDFLQGTLKSKSSLPFKVVVEVNGFGIMAYVSQMDWHELELEEELVLYTSLMLGQDLPKIFAFRSTAVRDLFDLLCSVKGIGPKAALNLLESFSLDELLEIVLQKNESVLEQIPGIGKKTAERIIFELSGKRKDLTFLVNQARISQSQEPKLKDSSTEARQALTSLGYDKLTIESLLRKALLKFENENTNCSTEELLRECLIIGSEQATLKSI